MKEEIEKTAAQLTGKPLWGCGRAADMAMFSFGERRQSVGFKGRPREIGDWALHVQCAWRIRRDQSILVGHADLYYPAGYEEGSDVPDDFDWDTQPNRRDQLLDLFFDTGRRSYVVKDIEVGTAGDLGIDLGDGLFLEVFPDDSVTGEYWRLFEPGKDTNHLVVTAKGLQT